MKELIEKLKDAVKFAKKQSISYNEITRIKSLVIIDSLEPIIRDIQQLKQSKICPKCGNTGRREPRTIDSPDGQECDCSLQTSLSVTDEEIEKRLSNLLNKTYFEGMNEVTSHQFDKFVKEEVTGFIKWIRDKNNNDLGGLCKNHLYYE